MILRSSSSQLGAAAILLTVGLAFGETWPFAQASQTRPAAPPIEAQRCTALSGMDIEGLPEAPTRIMSARLVDVPADAQAAGILAASPIKQYCQVQGYVAPQNKFELRLPLPAQWNQRFHLTPCAGFCGGVNGNACNFTLASVRAQRTVMVAHVSRVAGSCAGVLLVVSGPGVSEAAPIQLVYDSSSVLRSRRPAQVHQ